MSRHLSPATAQALIEVARRCQFMIEQGELKPEPGAEKKARDLQNRAKQALETAKQRRELR